MKAYTTAIELAANASGLLGRTIQADYIYGLLHEMEQGSERYGASKKISTEQSRTLLAYLADWYGKKDRPTVTDWLAKRCEKAPVPYRETLPAVVKAKAQPKGAATVPASVIVSLQRRVEKLELEINNKKQPLRLVENSIHKTINQFAITSPVTIKDVWNTVRDLFERDLGVKIHLDGKKTLPDWAKEQGVYEDLNGRIESYILEMKDALAGQKRLGL